MIRSAAYRIALAYSAAFSLATAALGVGVYASAHAALARQRDGRIAAEVSSLKIAYRADGLDALRRLVALRQAASATNDLRYGLYGADGHVIEGLLPAAAPKEGWHDLNSTASGPSGGAARLLVVRLGNGDRVGVAADLVQLERTDRLILGLLAAALAAVLAIGVGGALVLGAYLRRRLLSISTVAEGIAAGDLRLRAGMRDRGDEFDRLSGAVNAMLDRICILLETSRQLSADIAHDLRTPLTRLRNHLDEAALGDNGVAVIERAVELSDELLCLFQTILRLGEIEEGQLRRTFSEIDLAAVVVEICEGYDPVVRDGGRILRMAIDVASPAILGDRGLITQALVNLLDNAQLHTPDGTVVTVELRMSGERLALVVADDGPGVKIAEREIITRRFTRLEQSRSSPGYGLGLSVVAAIAKIHDATLLIGDNAPGLRMELAFPPIGRLPRRLP